MDEAAQRFEAYRELRLAGAKRRAGVAAFWSRAYARLLDRHRRDDGSRWSHTAIERATGGIATRHFAADLANGRIGDPGFAKIWAITLVLGASIEEWTEELEERRPETP